MKENKKEIAFKVGDKLELIKTDRIRINYSNSSLRAEYGIVEEVKEEQYKVKLVFNDGGSDYGFLWNFNDVKLLRTKNKLFDYATY